MFSLDTLTMFGKHVKSLADAIHVLTAFSDYLYEKGKIPEPLEVPHHRVILPPIYEKYLLYLQQGKAVSKVLLRSSRRVLAALNAYFEQHNIDLTNLQIQHVDDFLAEFNKPFCKVTRGIYRSQLRSFLRYLHDEKVFKKDIAELLVGARMFSDAQPPRFLRPEELKQLFSTITLDTPVKIRTYAMLLLAYSLGLRPCEIRQITLDDISFQRGELTIPKRKANNPVVLPLPEETLKSIALYVHKVRPNTPYRELFLTCHKPYRPISSNVVTHHISKAMKTSGLSASAYWLRHTYAQRLLYMGLPIFSIKEMMGHQSIQSTQRYLHINIEQMRKSLFDETI
jgi:site-specific recombinase XerD